MAQVKTSTLTTRKVVLRMKKVMRKVMRQLVWICLFQPRFTIYKNSFCSKGRRWMCRAWNARPEPQHADKLHPYGNDPRTGPGFSGQALETPVPKDFFWVAHVCLFRGCDYKCVNIFLQLDRYLFPGKIQFGWAGECREGISTSGSSTYEWLRMSRLSPNVFWFDGPCDITMYKGDSYQGGSWPWEASCT